jgi:uncharacterized membrane protein
MTFRKWFAVTAVCAAAAFGACGSDDSSGGDDDDDTANTCETGVSYAAVGKPFADQFCVSCHGKDVDVGDRVGAPEDVNFDTEAGLREHGMHVFEEVMEEMMPPKDSKQPTADQRADFLDWLECSGASKVEHDH